MVTAFDAKPLHESRSRDKAKIECLVVHGDRIYVGLSTGTIRIYRQGNEQDGGSSSLELLREEEKFSKQKIEQLAVIKEANLLVSLTNGNVSLHEPTTCALQDTLVQAKGATTFTVTSDIEREDESDVPVIISKLCVAVKRKVLIWTWSDSELVQNDGPREIFLPGQVKTLLWMSSTKLLVGLVMHYVVVDLADGSIKDITGPGSIGGPSAQEGGKLAGAGAASIGYLGIGSYAPKPLATRLFNGQFLLAKDINTHFIDYDGAAIPGRRQIPWPVAPDEVAYSYPFLLVLYAQKGTLEIRNPDTLNVLQRLTLTGAQRLHVPARNVSLAHAGKGFLVAGEKIIWRMNASTYDSQIDQLIEAARYDEALSLLGLLEDALLENKAGKSRQVRLLKGNSFFESKKWQDAMDLYTATEAPPENVIGLFPKPISQGLSAQKDKDSKASPLRNDKKMHLEGVDLKDATRALCGFLVSARTRMQRVLNFDGTLKDKEEHTEIHNVQLDSSQLLDAQDLSEDSKEERLQNLASLIDTTLFRAYMMTIPSLAGSLFRVPNWCDIDVVQDKLEETHRYNELIDFLQGKGRHEEALELLERLGRAKKPTENAPDLHGPDRIVAYLQNLGPENIDLLLRSAGWVIQADHENSREIFIDSIRGKELPRERVAEFITSQDRDLGYEYLDVAISEWQDDSKGIHDRMIKLLLTATEDAARKDDKDDLDIWQGRLIAILKQSQVYNAKEIEKLIPKKGHAFLEPRAILLGRLQQHEAALKIYVFDLKEYQKAETYCNQFFLDCTKANSSRPAEKQDDPTIAYQILLELYLTPPASLKEENNLDEALNLLANHGARLPALSTLKQLPNGWSLAQLEAYFKGRIRSANTRRSNALFAAALTKARDVYEDAKLKYGDGLAGNMPSRGRNIVVTEERLCTVCHRRFGESAIKVLPEGDVVHYGCSNR